MTDKRIINNSDRPARPEPGEDEAVQQPAVREKGGTPAESERAKEEERRRQAGEDA